MRYLSMCFAIATLCLVNSVTTLGQSATATEKTIAALENTWTQAERTSNPDPVAPLLADKFIGTGSDDGLVKNKTEELAELKATKYDSIEMSDVKVVVHGNTAVATGRFHARTTDVAGKPHESLVRWTDTWVKMPNGKWQCVASAFSPIRM